MNHNSTLKAVLNRQFVALGSYMPLESGRFECKHETRIGSDSPPISIKSFERVYPLMGSSRLTSLEAR